MKSSVSADIFRCVTLLILFYVGFNAAELEQNKNRRAGGTQGLYAFPRVGRSDPAMASSLLQTANADENIFAYENILDDYEDYPKSGIKRSSLIAFPRVGRNDAKLRNWAKLLALQQILDKRNGPSATSGLWFGPRLGKRCSDEAQLNEAATAAAKGQKELY